MAECTMGDRQEFVENLGGAKFSGITQWSRLLGVGVEVWR